ncbi:unnamed protein product [Clonostachys rosea]|uniref:Enoyl reductase (ER) domain-containing protein n=1 Tax=Bionectria ochroleuca TaxID=29856 RepID=A0ABY6U519_BIOOC|nr:unnamed protein product [Clonostachys rosea]
MRAIQINKLADSAETPKLSLITKPQPRAKPGFALVKVNFAAILPSDRLNAKGLFPYTSFPRTPGRDYSGVVVEVDSSSSFASWVGEEVYGTSDSELGFTLDGPHAEYCLIPEEMLAKKPTRLSRIQAATVGVPFTTARRCLQRGRVGKDETVLVLGFTGAVGSAAVQVAKAMGCKRVFRASRNPEDEPDVLLPGKVAAAGIQEQVLKLNDGRGVDVVVDTVGQISLMKAAFQALAVRGRYTWIAAPRDGSSAEFPLDIFQAYRKEAELIGCNTAIKSKADVAEEMKILAKWFNAGLLETSDEGDVELVDLDDAIEKGYERRGSKKHVIIRIT